MIRDLLPLPIAPADALAQIIDPGMFRLPEQMDSPAARVMLLAIALQESGLKARAQAGGGPARGLWQFELSGGCDGVLRHRKTRDLARRLCAESGIDATPQGLHWRIEHDDILACQAARLLLWTDPAPLPATLALNSYDADGAWALYLRTWRPGRPRYEHWPAHYTTARATVLSS